MTNKPVAMRILESTRSADSPEMRFQRQRDEIMKRNYEKREHDQLVKEVGDYVLAQMELNIDMKKVLGEIEKLKKAIEELGK